MMVDSFLFPTSFFQGSSKNASIYWDEINLLIDKLLPLFEFIIIRFSHECYTI